MSRIRSLARAGLAIAAFFAVLAVHAETVMTVNGADVDSTVLDAYAETRTQKPAAQITAEEKDALKDELLDIYLLTTQPRAKELEKDPQVKAQLELQMRGTLAQAAAQDFLSRNPATEDEILKEYKQQIELAPQQQFKARHILVETQSAAADLIKQLDDGADFAELAKSNSTGPSGPTGGDLGWFSPNQMVPPFSEAVAKLEDGAYTKEPVQTQFGWHVILREDSRDAEPPTLESTHDVIKQRIEQQKLQNYLAELRELNK
jgi:peptidyl-prolyl cis-trans isomerase C